MDRTVRRGCDDVARRGRHVYRAGMDLRGWIGADLASVRTKLFDGVLAIVPTELWYQEADGGGSTIAGLVLHLSRHHDLALNAVVREHAPRFLAHREALGLADAPTSAALAEREDRHLTAAGPADALIAYATDVFDTTADWLDQLSTYALDIEPDVDDRLVGHGLLEPDAVPWLFNMWRGKPVWWQLQWPVVGHCHAHTGEATSIRNRLGLSPF
jgi:hypothetical protein